MSSYDVYSRSRSCVTYQRYGKPSALTGFGLVTQSNAPDYIPFNSAAVGNVTSMTLISDAPAIQTSGISDDQRDDAYQQWMQCKLSLALYYHNHALP